MEEVALQWTGSPAALFTLARLEGSLVAQIPTCAVPAVSSVLLASGGNLPVVLKWVLYSYLSLGH